MRRPAAPAPAPPPDEPPLVRWLRVLRGGGLRMTPSRQAILRVLLEAEIPLSVKGIQRAAVPRAADAGDHALDFSSVCRTVLILQGLGLVRRVGLKSASTHYEFCGGARHHDHLVCTGCGKVTALEVSRPVKKLEAELARRHGFTLLTHSLEFCGRCGRCHPARA